MPTILTNGIQLPDKGSVDWYSSMQSNYNLIDTHLGNTDIHVTTEDKSNWDSKASGSHTHTSTDITDIDDYATKQYVDTSISGLIDNAPDALNTLNELSAALNDDSNFASTVTTALGNKANNADLATVATSGSYTDLSNKPSIPSKTSDLTNDSNFVDTSNSAVASGITSAKVTSYDTHIADTDIHVTTADKNKWNNGVTQAYVFRYSGTAVVPNSTIAYSTIDNTDNIKSGDKILDVDGKLFEITAVDTANQTVTVGSALIDLALDSGVMHLSGDETAAGVKTFEKSVYVSNPNSAGISSNIVLRSSKFSRADSVGDNSKIYYFDKENQIVSYIQLRKLSNKSSDIIFYVTSVDSNDQNISSSISILKSASGMCWLRPQTNDEIYLGYQGYAWKDVYTNQINSLTPSSLSLPSGTLANQVDISGYFTNTGSGDTNSYTALANGWVYLYVTACRTLTAYVQNGTDTLYSDYRDRSSDGQIRIMLPVQANNKFTTQWTTSTTVSITKAVFIPCQGNI